MFGNMSLLTSPFPSPQGGSETGRDRSSKSAFHVFPSPQGGSETWQFVYFWVAELRFHPLKAGRRLNDSERSIARQVVVSIPSRRVGDTSLYIAPPHEE